jgi:membrane protein required for beta-lactamase induction
MAGNLVIALVFILLYGWLVFKIAIIVIPRVKRFSLRDLILLITVAACLVFLLTRLGPLTAITFGVVTLVAAVVAGLRSLN